MFIIEFKLKYPEKLLNTFANLGHAAIMLTRSKYPMGKKVGKWKTIFRKSFLFYRLYFLSHLYVKKSAL